MKDFNLENREMQEKLGFALYSINKHAKIAKANNNKTEKEILYEVKNVVLNELEMQEIHATTKVEDNTLKVDHYLKYYKLADFGFHTELKNTEEIEKSGVKTKLVHFKKRNKEELEKLDILDKKTALAIISEFLIFNRIKKLEANLH